MKITPELAIRIVKRIIKILEYEIDIECCETEDQVYETITQAVQHNRYETLNWKACKNNIDYKVI